MSTGVRQRGTAGARWHSPRAAVSGCSPSLLADAASAAHKVALHWAR